MKAIEIQGAVQGLNRTVLYILLRCLLRYNYFDCFINVKMLRFQIFNEPA